MAVSYQPSKSGYYRVKLKAVWEHANFTYTPKFSAITFDQAMLDLAIAADVVDSAIPLN